MKLPKFVRPLQLVVSFGVACLLFGIIVGVDYLLQDRISPAVMAFALYVNASAMALNSVAGPKTFNTRFSVYITCGGMAVLCVNTFYLPLFKN